MILALAEAVRNIKNAVAPEYNLYEGNCVN